MENRCFSDLPIIRTKLPKWDLEPIRESKWPISSGKTIRKAVKTFGIPYSTLNPIFDINSKVKARLSA